MILVGTKLLVSDSAKNAMKNRKKRSIFTSLLLKLIYKEVVGSTCFSAYEEEYAMDVFDRHTSYGAAVVGWWVQKFKSQNRSLITEVLLASESSREASKCKGVTYKGRQRNSQRQRCR